MAQKLANNINDRTYQEVEYLKKSLGPILVAALAEICIRRPADPIEYLGHWLLRWRYNEELKRRDVQNAMEVVKARQWSQVKEDTEAWSSAAEGFEPVPPPVSTDIPNFDGSEMKTLEELDTDTLYAPPDEEKTGSQNASPKKLSNASRTSGDPATQLEKKKSTKLSAGGVLSESRKNSDSGSTGSGNKGGNKSQRSSKSKIEGDSAPGSRKGSKKPSMPMPNKSSMPRSASMAEDTAAATEPPPPEVNE